MEIAPVSSLYSIGTSSTSEVPKDDTAIKIAYLKEALEQAKKEEAESLDKYERAKKKFKKSKNEMHKAKKKWLEAEPDTQGAHHLLFPTRDKSEGENDYVEGEKGSRDDEHKSTRNLLPWEDNPRKRKFGAISGVINSIFPLPHRSPCPGWMPQLVPDNAMISPSQNRGFDPLTAPSIDLGKPLVLRKPYPINSTAQCLHNPEHPLLKFCEDFVDRLYTQLSNDLGDAGVSCFGECWSALTALGNSHIPTDDNYEKNEEYKSNTLLIANGILKSLKCKENRTKSNEIFAILEFGHQFLKELIPITLSKFDVKYVSEDGDEQIILHDFTLSLWPFMAWITVQTEKMPIPKPDICKNFQFLISNFSRYKDSEDAICEYHYVLLLSNEEFAKACDVIFYGLNEIMTNSSIPWDVCSRVLIPELAIRKNSADNGFIIKCMETALEILNAAPMVMMADKLWSQACDEIYIGSTSISSNSLGYKQNISFNCSILAIQIFSLLSEMPRSINLCKNQALYLFHLIITSQLDDAIRKYNLVMWDQTEPQWIHYLFAVIFFYRKDYRNASRCLSYISKEDVLDDDKLLWDEIKQKLLEE